jgi:Tfp pilus assembly protein PilV
MSYFDLKLTDSGDIATELSTVVSSFNINFDYEQYPNQRINFISYSNISNDENKNTENNIQSITFAVADKNTYKLANKTLYDLEEKIQYIKMVLKTELDSTENDDFGSEIYQYKHAILTTNSETVKETVRLMLDNIVSEVLDGARVEISDDLDTVENSGYFYCQSLIAKIYMDNMLITKFTIF